MPVLPVLDLLHGQIVRGIAGRRAEYRPIVSRLVDSAQPIAFARAFRQHFGFTAFYLADLDAIQDQQPAWDVYRELHQEGCQLWVDAGLRTGGEPALSGLLDAKVGSIIVGLETVSGPEELQHIVQLVGADRTVFSLDLKAGQSLGNVHSWKTGDPWAMAERAIAFGIRRLIVLDLARVGVGEGVGTESFCERLKQAHPELQLTAGGGVRGIEDVRRLHSAGVEYVLVASALHDGRITPAELKSA
jgi:phosphoribosylformimino-5-aminoimidazole carboxamide ribotide isomerase